VLAVGNGALRDADALQIGNFVVIEAGARQGTGVDALEAEALGLLAQGRKLVGVQARLWRLTQGRV